MLPAMPSRVILILSLPVAAALAEPGFVASAPIKNFRLPTFTPEGHRQLMLRAAEATQAAPDRVDVLDLDLTRHTGRADEAVDARLTAPSATFWTEKLVAAGTRTVRLERADLVLTGADWTYDHQAQTVIIRREARVVFNRPLEKIL